MSKARLIAWRTWGLSRGACWLLMPTKAVMKAGVWIVRIFWSPTADCTSSGLGDRAIWHSPRRSFCRRTLASGVMAKTRPSTPGLPAK
ncbi:hypothetical protein D3C81_1720950 [compost metagenome]